MPNSFEIVAIRENRLLVAEIKWRQNMSPLYSDIWWQQKMSPKNVIFKVAKPMDSFASETYYGNTWGDNFCRLYIYLVAAFYIFSSDFNRHCSVEIIYRGYNFEWSSTYHIMRADGTASLMKLKTFFRASLENPVHVVWNAGDSLI